MKYRAVWKPGGRPRRDVGSMKVNRKKLQILEARGTISEKGVESSGRTEKKTA